MSEKIAKEQVVEFIKNWIAEHKGLDIEALDKDEHMFQAGYLDSLGLFRLIFDVESEFDVEFDQSELFCSGATSIDSLGDAMAQTAVNVA
ncbi:acyl carrier protein [Hydrogenovibrio kuenenii]|uniref:acyl carrier protein n=1 Tax=Hydrogenovibrio kuenenii TaxID=63658 RepID=UPI000465D534|nr:acyl carrier protein [Hydrogenovibrio kuenenii]